jgi:hypothetical protein
MLEARIVAINTQGPLHGWTAPGAARAADSSHGDLMCIIICGSILARQFLRVNIRGSIPAFQPCSRSSVMRCELSLELRRVKDRDEFIVIGAQAAGNASPFTQIADELVQPGPLDSAFRACYRPTVNYWLITTATGYPMSAVDAPRLSGHGKPR